jgi:hypothetical protein
LFCRQQSITSTKALSPPNGEGSKFIKFLIVRQLPAVKAVTTHVLVATDDVVSFIIDNGTESAEPECS